MKTTEKEKFKVKIGLQTIGFDESQVEEYIKLGMKAEKHKSVFCTLQGLADRENLSVQEFVEKIKLQKDEALKSQLLEKVSGDEELAQKLFEMENQTKTQEKKTETDLIFENFKEIKSLDDIPDEAKILSETKNISLFDALLRCLFFQSKQIEKEQKNREKNKQRAVGSLKTTGAECGLSYISAMLKAINN